MTAQIFLSMLIGLTTLARPVTAAPTTNTPPRDTFSAALLDGSGQYLFLFSGSQATQVSTNFKSEGRILNITWLWPALSTPIDAAVNYSLSGVIYLFSGTNFYQVGDGSFSGPFKLGNEWPDIFRTGGVDSAGNKGGKSYFFKGCNFWTPHENVGLDGYLIHDVSTVNLPCNIETAWENGQELVLSKGNQYWIWGDNVTGPFPLAAFLDLCTGDTNLSSSPGRVNVPIPLTCNGDSRLCSLQLDKVTLPGSHNAGSGFAGTFAPFACFYQNHEKSVLEQLRFGIRYLDVDTCWSECGGNLGTCHEGYCAGMLCSMLIQIKTFLIENPTEVVMVNFNHDMTNPSDVIPELVRQIEEQLSQFLNQHFRETGQWPTLGEAVTTGKRLFVIITTQVTKQSFYPQKRWIIDEANMASTYTQLIVSQECSAVVNNTKKKCTELAGKPLIEVSVFGGFGACIDEMMASCDNFLFESLEVCSGYRAGAQKAPNVLMVDFPALSPPLRNVLAAVRQQNARNLLAFNNRCHIKLDAAATIGYDRTPYVFTGDRIIKYNLEQHTLERSNPISSLGLGLPVDVDAVISGRYWGEYNSTYFFKGCNYWLLENGLVSGPNSINTMFSGLECDLDAALGIDGSAYFLKGCNYWNYRRNWRVDGSIGPESLADKFRGLPCNIDAALDLDDDVYFFQNHNTTGSSWKYSGSVLTPGTSILDWGIDPIVCT